MNAQERIGTVAELQHQGTADTAERVSSEPLAEAGGNALLCGDVLSSNHQCPCRCVEQLAFLPAPGDSCLSVLP